MQRRSIAWWLAAACAVAVLSAGPHVRAAKVPDHNQNLADIACDVLVLDAQDAVVTGMTAAEFDVRVDGSPAQIVNVAPTPVTMSVVMLVDSTASQPLRRLEIQAAVRDGWFASLVTGDHARIGIIGPKLLLGPWLPESRTTAITLALGLLDRSASEPSPIWDAIDQVVTELADVAGPRAIIVLSDGRANGNRISVVDATARAVAADVAISSVSEALEAILPQAGGTLERFRPDDSLRRIADQTGGLFRPDGVARRTLRAADDPFGFQRQYSETPNRPAPLIAGIMTSLRQRHRIVFRAPSDGASHELVVRARHEGFRTVVRGRFTSPR